MQALNVGVGAPLLTRTHHHVNKTPVVDQALLGATLRLLWLLLLFDLGGLSLDFTGTSQRTVNLT